MNSEKSIFLHSDYRQIRSLIELKSLKNQKPIWASNWERNLKSWNEFEKGILNAMRVKFNNWFHQKSRTRFNNIQWAIIDSINLNLLPKNIKLLHIRALIKLMKHQKYTFQLVVLTKLEKHNTEKTPENNFLKKGK